MALIKCPDCGKEVSSNALTCIHCGCPISTNTAQRFTIQIDGDAPYSIYNSKGQYVGKTPLTIPNPDSSYEARHNNGVSGSFSVRLDKQCRYYIHANWNFFNSSKSYLSISSRPI